MFSSRPVHKELLEKMNKMTFKMGQRFSLIAVLVAAMLVLAACGGKKNLRVKHTYFERMS